MAERRFAALATLKNRPPADPAPEADVPELSQAPAPEEAKAPSPPPSAAIQPPAPPAAPAPAAAPVVPAAGQGRGRPPGKRSDPDWKPRTILMRTKTHRRVSGILLERDDGPDLSELIDELLSDWISKQA